MRLILPTICGDMQYVLLRCDYLNICNIDIAMCGGNKIETLLKTTVEQKLCKMNYCTQTTLIKSKSVAHVHTSVFKIYNNFKCTTYKLHKY